MFIFVLKYKLHETFDAIITWSIGLAFLLAALPHLENGYYFLGSVYAYRLVNPGMGQITAITIPVIQLAISVCLLSRIFLDAAHLSAMLLLICFASVQTMAFLSGLDISCGCFGPDHESTIGLSSLSLVYGLCTLSIIRNSCCFFLTTPVLTNQATDEK